MTNLYSKFARLFATDPLLVGTVATTDGITTRVALPDGALITARGTAAVGDKVFVRAGAIEGAAPNVATLTEIEI